MTDKHDILEALRKMYRDNGENAEAMQMVRDVIGDDLFAATKKLQKRMKKAGVKNFGFWASLEWVMTLGLLWEKKA